MGGVLRGLCCGGRGCGGGVRRGGHVAGVSGPRGIGQSPVEALPEFAQAGQAWASVQGFDVVDEFGDAE